MKTQILTILLATLVSGVFAQNSQVIKAIILPHNEEGFVRLLVTEHNNEPVTVLFKKGNRIITKDRIKTDDYEKGFIKLYDIGNLKNGDYKIEIQNQDNVLSYDFTTKSNESVAAQFWKTQLNNNTRLAGIHSADSLVLQAGN